MWHLNQVGTTAEEMIFIAVHCRKKAIYGACMRENSSSSTNDRPWRGGWLGVCGLMPSIADQPRMVGFKIGVVPDRNRC